MADDSSRAGARYATPDILAYVDAQHGAHDAGLARAFASPGQDGLPAIQVGASEGALLTLLARLVSARRIVEVGTLAGYSALRLARGLAAGGRVDTIEIDPRHAEVARANLAAAGAADLVHVHVGDGPTVLDSLASEGPFDLVFVDADKERYDVYARWAAQHLRPGGLFVADNVYFFGRLLERSPGADAMRRMHEEAGRAFDAACVPTPDGLLVGVRRA